MFVKSKLINILLFIFIATVGGIFGAFFYYTSLAPEIKLFREPTENAKDLLGGRLTGLGIYSPGDVSRLNIYTASSVASFFKKKNQTGDVLQDIYLPAERLGIGVVVSMDGWIMTRPTILGNREAKTLIVNIGKNFYDVEKSVYDPLRKISFIKLAASNLSVLNFGDSDEIKFGDNIFIVGGRNRLQSSVVVDISWQEAKGRNFLIQNSEELGRQILIRGRLSQEFVGAPVVSYQGEALGIIDRIDASGNAITAPINNFKKSIQQLFAGAKFKQNYLGLSYIDLNAWKVPGASEAYGFLAQAVDRLGARGIVRGGPAEVAGFAPNDIILKIDENWMRGPLQLGEFLDDYKSGDTINFTVKRGERELLLKAILEEK